MKILRMIEQLLSDILDKIIVQHKMKMEVKRFNIPERKKIYTEIELTADQKSKIDDFYKHHYSKKIPYIWHKHYTAYTGNFDVKYFPEHLFIPVFEWYMNRNKEYDKVLEDKNFLPIVAKGVGIKMPKSIISSTAGVLRDADNHLVKLDGIKQYLKDGKYFCKPSKDTGSGKGCHGITVENGLIKMGGGCPKMKNQKDGYSKYSVNCRFGTPDLASSEGEKSIFGQSGGGDRINGVYSFIGKRLRYSRIYSVQRINKKYMF